MIASNRIWVIAGSLIIVAVVALAGLLGVKPQFDAAKVSDDDRAAVEFVNTQHRATLATLKDEFARLPEIQAEVGELRKSVGATIDLEAVIAELAALQAATGVTITNYSSADPVPFAATAAVGTLVPGTINSSNFLTTEIQLSVTGAPGPFMAFVKAVQSSSRLYFVSDITVGAEGENTVTLLVYTLLDTPLVDPAPVAETPTPEAAASE